MAFQSDSHVPHGPYTREKNEHSRAVLNRYASCLRIPEDTTWPKMPERRLPENINNIKVPCLVTLPGKLQKVRNVHLPHSQFVKDTPRKNDMERNTCGALTFRTTARDRNASDCLNSKFKTTITPQPTSSVSLKNDATEKNEVNLREITENCNQTKDADNYDTKSSCEANTVQSKLNSQSKQINVDSEICTDTITSPVIINTESDFSSAKINNLKTNHSQDCINLKVSNIHQDCKELNNYRERCKANNERKEEKTSNKNLSTLRENQEYFNNQMKCDWMSEKLKSRLYISDTTDSEIYSSDTTRTDQMKNILERRIQSTQKKFNLNCCNKIPKYPQIKREPNPCHCNHYERLWTTKRLAHHSEPQIRNVCGSWQCPSECGKVGHCCAKEFHRVASDSDCRTMMHKKVIPRKHKDQAYDPLRSFRSSCNDIFKNLHSRNREESVHPQMCNDGQVLLTDAPPQVKKRKCHIENDRSCDNEAFYLFSSMETREKKVTSSSAKDILQAQAKTGSENSVKKASLTGKIRNQNNSKSMFSSNYDGTNLSEQNQTNHNRLLNFKTALVFSSLVYILILSLPVIYDYFFYEEYETFEELSYIEIAMQYVISSFEEAFTEIFDFISKIFFRSRTCRKCSSSNNS